MATVPLGDWTHYESCPYPTCQECRRIARMIDEVLPPPAPSRLAPEVPAPIRRSLLRRALPLDGDILRQLYDTSTSGGDRKLRRDLRAVGAQYSQCVDVYHLAGQDAVS